MITDAHQHVWDTRQLSYPWLEHAPELNRPRLPEDAATPGVTRVVFVQADAADGAAEAEWVQELSPQWPELAGIVAYAPVESPELPAALDALAALPLFRGVRRLLQDEAPGFATSADFVRGLRELAARGIPFDACVRHHQLDELRLAAAQVPGLTVVLDHLGKPPVRAGISSAEGEAWVRNLRALAELPGAAVKLSGMSPEADGDRPLAEQVVPFLEVALEVFGPERSLVGSDWPVSAATPHGMTNAEWFDLVGSLVADHADRALVLSGTAERIYRLGAAAD